MDENILEKLVHLLERYLKAATFVDKLIHIVLSRRTRKNAWYATNKPTSPQKRMETVSILVQLPWKSQALRCMHTT